MKNSIGYIMNKDQYMKWLTKKGLNPDQIKVKKKLLGNPVQIEENIKKSKYELSNKIPENGTKEVDVSKAKFCTDNYALVPSYNKGPIQVVSLEDLKNGAGRKL
jgi:hypothetical protein